MLTHCIIILLNVGASWVFLDSLTSYLPLTSVFHMWIEHVKQHFKFEIQIMQKGGRFVLAVVECHSNSSFWESVITVSVFSNMAVCAEIYLKIWRLAEK